MLNIDNDFRSQVFEQFSRVCKALGHAHRFEILFLLVNGEHTVEQLSNESGMSFANTSQHLQNLKRSGLVLSRRQGNTIFYRLADPSILLLLQAARSTAESRLAEMDRLLDQLYAAREDCPITDLETIKEVRERGQITLLDVRPEEEYQNGHIPDTINLPLQDLEDQLADLSRSAEYVVLCRDMYSTLSDQAVRLLIDHGFQASRLSVGFLEWKAQGGEIVYTAY